MPHIDVSQSAADPASGWPEGRVNLNVPKDPTFIAAARLTAAGVGLRAGLSFEVIEDLKIIVAEACTFCIADGGTAGRLRIAFEARPDCFVVTVTDPHFRMARLGDGGVSLSEDRIVDELAIIRGLAEEFECHAALGGGLLLRMTKRTR